MGYLAEERGLYPKYALMDQLLYFAALRDVPRAEAKRRIRYWAQRLEVEEYLYPSAPAQAGRRGLLGGSAQREKPKRPDQLSKGNQQKIQGEHQRMRSNKHKKAPYAAAIEHFHNHRHQQRRRQHQGGIQRPHQDFFVPIRHGARLLCAGSWFFVL